MNKSKNNNNQLSENQEQNIESINKTSEDTKQSLIQQIQPIVVHNENIYNNKIKNNFTIDELEQILFYEKNIKNIENIAKIQSIINIFNKKKTCQLLFLLF